MAHTQNGYKSEKSNRTVARILSHTNIPEDNKDIIHHWLELARNTDSENSINNMYNIE